MECFICEINGEKVTLFSAITKEGVVAVCEECSAKENILVIKRIGELQLKESERNQTVYERLSRMAGIDPVGHKEKVKREEKIELKRQELRKPFEKNNKSSFSNLKQIQPQFKEDLIRNYYWTIFNARRAFKLTQKQLAEAIAEPEASIKLVERGILPDNYAPFIKKLQTYLGVILFDKQLKKNSSFLTESQMEEKKENEPKVPYWKRIGFLQKNKEKRKNDQEGVLSGEELENKQKEQDIYEMNELTKEEIDRITFK